MIALVFCGDLKYCPYIRRYIERLEENNIKYNVYFWNRGGFELDLPGNYFYYGAASDLRKSKMSKIMDFWNFRSWLLKKFKTDMPNKYVILSTLTGVLLGNFLSNKQYVYDIRDYSYEHIKPFYSIEKKIIYKSIFTAISSKGFMAFLPKHDYVIAHNFNREDIIEGAKFHKSDGKINFVWNGVMRYFEFQKQYLDVLKNDERFEIVYYGDGPELAEYQEYCSTNGFTNVVFTGAYNNSNKARILSEASILNNCYGYTKGAGSKLKYAVSNRFYDGIIYHIPQLVELEGYKTEWATTTGIGVAFQLNSNFADDLYAYYMSIDSEEFDRSCDEALKKVIHEDDRYMSMIDMFILQ